MLNISFLLILLGVFSFAVYFYIFNRKELNKITFYILLSIIFLQLFNNIVIFTVFDKNIKPLISDSIINDTHEWFIGLMASALILNILTMGAIIGSFLGSITSGKLKNTSKKLLFLYSPKSSSDGNSIILKCPECHKSLSYSWILFSNYKTKYKCVNCGSLMEWGNKRMIVGVIIASSTPVVILISKLLANLVWPGILFALILALILFLIVPGQYRMVECKIVDGEPPESRAR